MTPDQTRVIEAAMEEYRTSVRPLTVLYARIARRFGLPETVPGLVNNAVRVAFDHLSEVLAGDEPAQFTPGGQDAMWHLLLARCDLLMMCVDTVRNGVEAMAASVDEHTAETLKLNAQRAYSLREKMRRSETPLHPDDPIGNTAIATELTGLLADYLELFGRMETFRGQQHTDAPRTVTPFSDEQSRTAINLRQHYDNFVAGNRQARSTPFDLRWESMDGAETLCSFSSRISPARLLGPRSVETETMLTEFQANKASLARRQEEGIRRLDEVSRLYRILRLPLMASEAAVVLREFDMRSLLGSHVLVIGTNAMPAYALEAAGFIADAPDETEDFDLSWIGLVLSGDDTPVWSALQAVDRTYTVNTERPFQARNAAGYEIDLLVAPSRVGSLLRRDRPRPTTVPTQEWLLKGRFVDHAVVARDGSPARIVAPDPRWFALHKLWLSTQDSRNPLKRDKDRRQGNAVLNAVDEAMPHYRLDDAFQAELPPELVPIFEVWRESRPPRSTKPAWARKIEA